MGIGKSNGPSTAQSSRMHPSVSRAALPLVLGAHLVATVHPLSVTESPRAQTARSRLAEALRSPSRKLTLHPELVLPEPSDPTALLLRASEVTKLSESLRTKARANAAFVVGTPDALAPMGREQEGARGSFPGPVPIVWSPEHGDEGGALERLAEVDGVEGVMVPFFGGKEIGGVDGYLEEADDDPGLADRCGAIWEAGMQPIPEIVLDPEAEWTEEDVLRLVDAIKASCGGADPVSIVFTNGETRKPGGEGEEQPSTPGIAIPASMSKRLAFLGSVRTDPGGGRMNAAASRLKSRGFSGAVLRADCVPGYRLNPDLGDVAGFWSAAIGDLKSLKSKTFSFRAKVKIENDVPMEWFNYQKDVMESGALGKPGGEAGGDFNPDAGDYMGF